MKTAVARSQSSTKIIKMCHVCTQVTESSTEVEKCVCCGKSFLPLNYFNKIHDHQGQKYNFKDLYAESHELEESDLIIGLYVLW
jgi:hypothetical protein